MWDTGAGASATEYLAARNTCVQLGVTMGAFHEMHNVLITTSRCPREGQLLALHSGEPQVLAGRGDIAQALFNGREDVSWYPAGVTVDQ
ncbi:amidase family protein [Mycobacteroides abscessus subsp. abscessus]|nr:amidase family protein [Mycobacteroides abscessus subsp. abscessus]